MRQFLLTGVYSQSFRVCCPGAAHDPQGDYQLSEKSKKVRTFRGLAGAAREDRTLDLSLTKGVLYH
jgi:hypothetical protein